MGMDVFCIAAAIRGCFFSTTDSTVSSQPWTAPELPRMAVARARRPFLTYLEVTALKDAGSRKYVVSSEFDDQAGTLSMGMVKIL